MPPRGAAGDARQLTLFGASSAPLDARADGTAAAPVDAESAAGPLYRHPRGQREVRLEGHGVVYALKRMRRKSIGFIVGPEGLSVHAPGWVGAAAIEAALQAKARWILRKLADQRRRSLHGPSTRTEWRDGVQIAFLGRPVVVVLDPAAATAGGAVLDAEPALDPGLDAAAVAAATSGPPRLRIGLPPDAGAEQIRDVVQSWLQRQARRIFEQRCAHYAPLLRVTCRRLALSSAQTRWGSASADGSIRLNWRLVHHALPTIDYVVAHELAHLREMNHSARFWDVVRSVVPDYEQARGALRKEVLPRGD